MELAMTTMSKNGQVVIPSEIRKDAKLKPMTKFIVFNQGNDILLRKIDKRELLGELQLIRDIQESEEQIARGEYIEADTSMSEEKILKLLEKKD